MQFCREHSWKDIGVHGSAFLVGCVSHSGADLILNHESYDRKELWTQIGRSAFDCALLGTAVGGGVTAARAAVMGRGFSSSVALTAGTRIVGEGGLPTFLGVPKTAGPLTAEGEALLRSTPVGSALKIDLHHRAPTFIRKEAAEAGVHFKITGYDNIPRTLTQIPGTLNGRIGRFEYIVDPSGNLTHQRFVPDGTINGRPNAP